MLIESEDENALLAGIEYMLDNTSKFDKKTIRQYAVDHFSNEVIGSQIGELYTEILEPK